MHSRRACCIRPSFVTRPELKSNRGRCIALLPIKDYNGNYVKIPIKVTEIIFVYPSGERSQRLEVTAYYSYDERQWINCGYGGTVSECESYSLFGRDNGLESMFMYKAQVSGRGIYGTIYFDL